MKARFSGEFQMSLFGSTGYANCSEIEFGFQDRTKLLLPTSVKQWNLVTFLPILTEQLQSFKLGIPSGNLRVVDNNSIACKFFDDKIIITGDFEWNGQLGGLLGGMSGFGDFWLNDKGQVIEGLFKPQSFNRNLQMTIEKYRALQCFLRSKDENLGVDEKELAECYYSQDPQDKKYLSLWEEELLKCWEKLKELGLSDYESTFSYVQSQKLPV